jgi:hypothetical protein
VLEAENATVEMIDNGGDNVVMMSTQNGDQNH